MAKGTGKATRGKLYINSELVVPVQVVDQNYNPNAKAHYAIHSDKPTRHTTGEKEWELEIEIEVHPGDPIVRPDDFDESNPVDVVVIGARENIRYVSGITSKVGRSIKKNEAETMKFTLSHFKNRVFE